MCGIVGFIDNNKDKRKILDNMMESIRHRGPDGAGTYVDETVALGHNRLAIIDINAGIQPQYNEDKSLVIIFNGEIYNYKELRKELKKKGHKFYTKSDTEVIIHSYEEWHTNTPKHLRGMFAFLIYDKNKKELFGARDMFGIKPLYYYSDKENFMVASEIKAFLKHPCFKKILNEDALESYLTYQYSSLDETLFKNVYKLKPGHYFLKNENEFKIGQYFDFKFQYDENKSLEEWTILVKNVMQNSIKMHKISDVEVGSFLSSGIDSSLITAMSKVNKTFTVGFDFGEKYNEISYAKDLSWQLGIKHITKIITPEEYFKEFSKILYHLDEPVADPSVVPLYFLCELASKHVKVILSGEGADELFAGYNVYNEPIDYPMYSKYIPFFIRRILSKICEIFPEHRGINFIVRKGKHVEEKFIGNAHIFSDKERKKILKIKTNAKGCYELVKPLYDKVKEMDEVSKMQYIDNMIWLPGDILEKADKMSMANSLEVRVPFLDKEVYNLATRISIKYKVTNNTTKYVLRESAKEYLPDKWSKKKKLGFPTPIREFLKVDKYYDLVKGEFESEVAEKYFDVPRIIKLLDDHKKLKKDNSRKIWTIYTFLVWYKVFFKEMSDENE